MPNKDDEVIGSLEKAGRESARALAEKINHESRIAKLLDNKSYNREQIIEETKFYLQQSVLDIFEAGKRMLALKEKEGWGDFEKIIHEDFGIDPSTARRFMGIYLKFANRAALHDLGRTKLISALSIPEEELAKLDTEGTLLGIPKDKLKMLSTREFQAEIRKWQGRTEKAEKREENKDREIADLKERLSKVFNPHADDLEKEVENKAHELFLTIKGNLICIRHIADAIGQSPEKFTESSKSQMDGLMDMLLRVVAEFREQVHTSCWSVQVEAVPSLEDLRTVPIGGKWKKDLAPEAYDIEPGIFNTLPPKNPEN